MTHECGHLDSNLHKHLETAVGLTEFSRIQIPISLNLHFYILFFSLGDLVSSIRLRYYDLYAKLANSYTIQLNLYNKVKEFSVL